MLMVAVLRCCKLSCVVVVRCWLLLDCYCALMCVVVHCLLFAVVLCVVCCFLFVVWRFLLLQFVASSVVFCCC